MYDASAFCGSWAYRQVTARFLEELISQLKEAGLAGAAISPVEAILHPEPMTANRRFLKECAACAAAAAAGTADRSRAFAVYPVPVIDPNLSNWEEQLAECMALANSHRLPVPAVKIFPNYHGYEIDLPALDALAQSLAALGITLCVQLRMEDERARHRTVNVPPLSIPDIVAFAGCHPELSILVCAPYMRDLAELNSAPNISVEMSFVESGHLLRDALRHMTASRLLVGTHAPLFIPAVGVAKAKADVVEAEVFAQISTDNFMRLFGAKH